MNVSNGDLRGDIREGIRISLADWACLLGALLLGAICGGLVFGIG